MIETEKGFVVIIVTRVSTDSENFSRDAQLFLGRLKKIPLLRIETRFVSLRLTILFVGFRKKSNATTPKLVKSQTLSLSINNVVQWKKSIKFWNIFLIEL